MASKGLFPTGRRPQETNSFAQDGQAPLDEMAPYLDAPLVPPQRFSASDEEDDVGQAAPMFGTDYGFRPAGSKRIDPPKPAQSSNVGAVPVEPNYPPQPFETPTGGAQLRGPLMSEASDPSLARSHSDYDDNFEPIDPYGDGAASVDPILDAISREDFALGHQPQAYEAPPDPTDYQQMTPAVSAPPPMQPAPSAPVERKPQRPLATPVLPDHPNAASQNTPFAPSALVEPAVPKTNYAQPTVPDMSVADEPVVEPTSFDLDQELRKLETEIASVSAPKPVGSWTPPVATAAPASPPIENHLNLSSSRAAEPNLRSEAELDEVKLSPATRDNTVRSDRGPTAERLSTTSELDIPGEVSPGHKTEPLEALLDKDLQAESPAKLKELSEALSPNPDVLTSSTALGQAAGHARNNKSLMVAGGLLAVAAVGVIGFFTVSWMGTTDTSSQLPRLIIADSTPVKTPVPTQADPADSAAKLVYERVSGAETTGEQRIVDSAEQPVNAVPVVRDIDISNGLDSGIAARPVRTVIVRADGTIVDAAPASGTQAQDGAVGLSSQPTSVAATPSQAQPSSGGFLTPLPAASAPAQATDAANTASIPTQTSSPGQTSTASRDTGASAATTLSASAPQPTARPAAVAAPNQQQAAQQPVQVAAAPAAAAPSQSNRSNSGPVDLLNQAVQPATQPVASGGYVVQVSSQRNEADARQSASRIQSRHSDIVGGRGVLVQRADLGTRGIYYRARFGPMTRADADRVCSGLKTRGQDCFVQRN